MSESEVFLDGEADAWHLRNKDVLAAYRIEDDIVALTLGDLKLSPRCIMDLGCSSGERLSALCERYVACGLGIDASRLAIEVARKRDPEQDWFIRDWTELVAPGYDLVVTSYVWHWVARSRLIQAMLTVQESVAVGGYLVLNDFWPSSNLNVPYKHREGITTSKRRYDDLLIATDAFERVTMRYYFDSQTQEQCSCSVLKRLC